jgi:hypothetical protein
MKRVTSEQLNLLGLNLIFAHALTAPFEQLAGTMQKLRYLYLTWVGWIARLAATSWIVLRQLIASIATLALNSGL